MRLLAPLILATSGLVYAGAAHAAQAAEPGKNVGLVIEDVDAAAHACGVSTAQVREAAAAVIAAAGWSVREGASDYLYVNVNVIYGPKHATCAFNISAGIARSMLTGYGRHVLGFTRRGGSDGKISSNEAARSILDRQQDVLKQLLAQDDAERI